MSVQLKINKEINQKFYQNTSFENLMLKLKIKSRLILNLFCQLKKLLMFLIVYTVLHENLLTI